MVRGRGDESHARSRVPYFGDGRINLPAGELAAFTGLRALGHFDLQFLRVDEVKARDTEAARGDLFNGAVARIAVGVQFVTGGIFAAFAGVALAADAVHGDGK